MHSFQVCYRLPGVGYVGEIVIANCAAAAQAAVQAKYPNAQVGSVKQLD
jgi:hypothetical protein